MDTSYIVVNTKDGMIFIHEDEEPQFTTLEELEMAIAESFPESYVDPEKYARRLHDMCMAEYENKYKEVLKS